jgi:hypothetical protein
VTAQVPTPEPPICARPYKMRWAGGSPVSFVDVSLTLPVGVGEFGLWHFNPSHIEICYVGGNSAIVIDATTGKEVKREVSDPAANALLDLILASVQVRGR